MVGHGYTWDDFMGGNEEIINGVKLWNSDHCVVEIKKDGNIVVDGKVLSDDEIQGWFSFCLGCAKNRKGEK